MKKLYCLKRLLLLSAFLWGSVLYGQEQTLTGKISDANTGEA